MVFLDEHDFKKFPELTNAQLAVVGFSSPHVQIVDDFLATVVRVHDGDTITLRVEFRDFDFPLRLTKIDAPELNTGTPGEESRDWLRDWVEGEEVTVKIDRKNRVGKFGRLLGEVFSLGMSVNDASLNLGFSVPFGKRGYGEMLDINAELARAASWQ